MITQTTLYFYESIVVLRISKKTVKDMLNC